MDFLVYITALWQDMISGVGAIVLIVLSLIALFATTLTMKKKVFKVSILTVVGFYVFVKCTCGPNFFDVRIMYPMAEKISQYIEKYGIPKSLKDIPDLPYLLEKCEKNIIFKKYTGIENIDVNNSKEATYKIEKEYCKYSKNRKTYEVYTTLDKDLNSLKSEYFTIKIYHYKNKTGVKYDMEFDIKNNMWKMRESIGKMYKNIHIYDNKTSGICNPMRQ